MLTKDDLQAIQETVETAVDTILDKKLKSIKMDIKKINKNTEKIIDYFDQRDIRTQKRVEKIEKYLNLNKN